MSEPALGSPARRTIAGAILCMVLATAVPVPASALTISAPAHVLERADIAASLTASDHAGLALLYVDGQLARSTAATGGPGAMTFVQVPLSAGSHHLRMLLRSSDGLTSSSAREIVSWSKPVPPVLISPKGGYAGRSATIVAKAGPGTTSLKLALNGKTILTKSASAGQVVNLGVVTLAAGSNTVVIEAANPVSSTSGTFKIRRLDFPWPTCIVIDKSDFKLYWVKDGMLVKAYPVAIGKPSTPTPARNWRIDEKYVYTDWGVYGPRRMRLYKQVGSSFQYTGFGIHGTNQEWVIGTMASHGCIRMYNRDVLELFPQVPLYTMVQTRE